ncbi:hypothetical protein D3C74_266660 [compost metagenome]
MNRKVICLDLRAVHFDDVIERGQTVRAPPILNVVQIERIVDDECVAPTGRGANFIGQLRDVRSVRLFNVAGVRHFEIREFEHNVRTRNFRD